MVILTFVHSHIYLAENVNNNKYNYSTLFNLGLTESPPCKNHFFSSEVDGRDGWRDGTEDSDFRKGRALHGATNQTRTFKTNRREELKGNMGKRCTHNGNGGF